MKKKLLFGCLLLIGFTFSCSKDDGGESGGIEITDAASLSRALNVEGATVRQGNIPSPGNSGYGNSMEVQTTSIILTPLSQFQFTAFAPGAQGLLFLQIDGANEYFEIPYTSGHNGDRTIDINTKKLSKPVRDYLTNLSARSHPMSCSPGMNLHFTAGAHQPQTYTATVQTYSTPVQYPTDGDFSNIHNWSPPRTVQIRLYPTGVGNTTVTLTWDKDNSDIDLWLEEPNGNTIYFASPTSSTGGQLDYDNTSGFGPENIFYASEANMLSGQYTVKVHYYSGFYNAGSVNYSVVVKNGNSVNSYQGSLSSSDEVDVVTNFSR